MGQCRQAGRLDQLLLSFKFLQSKLTTLGPRALIEDFRVALALPGRDREATESLATLRDTLLLSADLLRERPEQFAAQLHARLGQPTDPLIGNLLDAAVPPRSALWLQPLRRCLPDARGPLVATIRVGEGITAVALSPDSTIAVSACRTALDLWDLTTLDRIRRIEMPRQGFMGRSRLHVLADGNVVILLYHGFISALNLSNGELQWTLGAPEDNFREMSLSADERRLVACNGKYLVLWDLPARKELWRIELPSMPNHQPLATGRYFRASTITADGTRIVASEFNGPIAVWNVERRCFERQLEGCQEEVTSFIAGTAPTRVVGFAAAHYSRLDAVLRRAPGIGNRKDLFSEGVDTVYVRHVVQWDVATGKIIANRHFAGEIGPSNGLALHRAVNRLLSASNLGSIDLIELDGDVKPTSLLGHDSPAMDIALFNDGTHALSACRDGTLKLWDLAKAFDRSHTINHTKHVTTVSFGFDRARCASASLDHSIIVWREREGAIEGTRHSLDFGVKSLHLLPDGQHAFAVCYDKRCRVIELGSFEGRVVDSTEYAERMLGSALSADGRTAAIAYQIEDVDVDAGGAVFYVGRSRARLGLATGVAALFEYRQ